MLKLFQAVHDAGSQPDYDNDDLMSDENSTDGGFRWICYVDKTPTPWALLQAAAATKLLGDLVTGVKVQQLPSPYIEIFLSRRYNDIIDTDAERV